MRAEGLGFRVSESAVPTHRKALICSQLLSLLRSPRRAKRVANPMKPWGTAMKTWTELAIAKRAVCRVQAQIGSATTPKPHQGSAQTRRVRRVHDGRLVFDIRVGNRSARGFALEKWYWAVLEARQSLKKDGLSYELCHLEAEKTL